MSMDWIADPNIWTALLTLTALEIVLGIDNIVFISILTNKLPKHQQERGRITGLGAAMVMRIILLFFASWIVGLTDPIFSVIGRDFSGKDLIMLAGGLFLIGKATMELHDRLEGEEHHTEAKAAASFGAVIGQILLLDAVFSIDSVITAVGMTNVLGVMIAAVVISIIVMIVSANSIAGFVERHPTVKVLALSFLILIGFTLVAEGFHVEIPKGYIYFAMAFSVMVEVINLQIRKKDGERKPIHLRTQFPGQRVVERAGTRSVPAGD
jgi:predicted tellurium resistance membrane protein TerC